MISSDFKNNNLTNKTMKNTKIINRLIDYYLEGSELTQDEHNTVRSLKEEMQAINYTRCCELVKDKNPYTFEIDINKFKSDKDYCTELESLLKAPSKLYFYKDGKYIEIKP